MGTGAGLSMIGLPEIGAALFSAGLGLAITEIQDILDDGVYNKSAATYVEVAMFSGLMGYGAGTVMSSTVLTPTTKVLVMTAFGGGSSAASQQAAKGEIDPKKVLTSAAFAEFSSLASQQFTRAFNKEIDDLAYVPRNSSAAFNYDEAAGTTTKLYRVMSQSEYDTLLNNGGKFTQSPVGPIMEEKWFATSTQDAAQWGSIFYPAGSYRMIEIEVPSNSLSQMYYNPHLDGIGPAYAGSIDWLNSIIGGVHTIK